MTESSGLTRYEPAGEGGEGWLEPCEKGMAVLYSDVAALEEENKRLREIVADLHWMARRYADNRMTYATGLHNDRTRELLAMGVDLNPGSEGLWARDGMGDDYAEITAEESATVKSAAEAERNDREDAERCKLLDAALNQVHATLDAAASGTDCCNVQVAVIEVLPILRAALSEKGET
jgi:hypothetical protein